MLLLAALLAASTVAAADAPRPSILFVNIDDLNDWNGTLGGHPQAVTPHLDRLAARGLTFTRAICSSPVCFPSRTSVFTGIHPVRSGAISNFNWGRPWRFYVGDAVTLPKHLQSKGWTTLAGGKNFHDRSKPEFQHYFGLPREATAVPGSGYTRGPIGWGVARESYEEMPDHRVVSWGTERIRDTDGPAFFSIGIYKPHVPWILPQSSFDRYPLDGFVPPDAPTNDLDDLPGRLRLLAHNEAKFDAGFHERLRQDGQVEAWARAYLAAASFADDQLGRLLDAWEASPHARDGYIVLWSDHGYMLGEKEGWGKFKPWYDASRVNLIVCGPGIPRGRRCDRAVSLLDVYPTLLDLLGVEPPAAQELGGRSLRPLVEDPEADWDHPAVMSHEEDGIRYDSILGNRFRMTRLITGETELYDLDADPNEWRNLAGLPEHAATIERLSRHLTFEVPTPPADGWLEAEDVPCQTSADFGRRGNFHYPRPNAGASAGRYLVAELKTGAKSYVEFVWHAEPGDYAVGVRLGPVNAPMRLSLKSAAVAGDARQATAEADMEDIGGPAHQLERDGAFREVSFGTVRIRRPGRQLLRIQSESERPLVLRIDRLRLNRIE
mgnify:CR=1 FL=1